MIRAKQAVALLAVAVVAMTVAAAEEPKKCSASAKECELQIRQMLAGRRYLGVQIADTNPGVMVKSIVPNGPAERADLRAGDRILSINGHDITQKNVHDFKNELDRSSSVGGRLWIIIRRNGIFMKVEARLEPMSKQQIDKVVSQHLAQSHTAATVPNHQ
jgi:predicted metalloprotease with PDZ domain